MSPPGKCKLDNLGLMTALLDLNVMEPLSPSTGAQSSQCSTGWKLFIFLRHIDIAIYSLYLNPHCSYMHIILYKYMYNIIHTYIIRVYIYSKRSQVPTQGSAETVSLRSNSKISLLTTRTSPIMLLTAHTEQRWRKNEGALPP